MMSRCSPTGFSAKDTMPNLNRVFLAGHLGQDPEVKQFENGCIANMSLATTESIKQGNEWVKTTSWHRVVAKGKQAEYVAKYLHKGAAIFVEGKLKTRDYQDKSGAKKYITEVIVTSVNGLGGKGRDAEEGRDNPMVQSAMDILGAAPKEEEDIPF